MKHMNRNLCECDDPHIDSSTLGTTSMFSLAFPGGRGRVSAAQIRQNWTQVRLKQVNVWMLRTHTPIYEIWFRAFIGCRSRTGFPSVVRSSSRINGLGVVEAAGVTWPLPALLSCYLSNSLLKRETDWTVLYTRSWCRSHKPLQQRHLKWRTDRLSLILLHLRLWPHDAFHPGQTGSGRKDGRLLFWYHLLSQNAEQCPWCQTVQKTKQWRYKLTFMSRLNQLRLFNPDLQSELCFLEQQLVSFCLSWNKIYLQLSNWTLTLNSEMLIS